MSSVDDVEKYGRHLRRALREMAALPADQQRWASLPRRKSAESKTEKKEGGDAR